MTATAESVEPAIPESTTVENGGTAGNASVLDLHQPVTETLQRWRGIQVDLEHYLDELFSELDRFREQFRGEELQLREERLKLVELRTKLAYDRADWEADHLDSNRDLLQQTHELQRERTELELELESVRQRSAELTDQLGEQKRNLAQERESWTNEFRQLRHTLEKQSQLLTQRVEAQNTFAALQPGVAAATAQGTAAAAAATAQMDPVLGSVMSQFQMLQKDAARRRAQLKKSSEQPIGIN